MAWHRVNTWRGIYDWTISAGHVLLHTDQGNIESTALKPDEFYALVKILNECEPVFTDGMGKIATGEEVVGGVRPAKK